MEIFAWDDGAVPTAAGDNSARPVDQSQCGQFSSSISNGQRGMTVRFESEDEFRQFLQRGAVEKRG